MATHERPGPRGNAKPLPPTPIKRAPRPAQSPDPCTTQSTREPTERTSTTETRDPSGSVRGVAASRRALLQILPSASHALKRAPPTVAAPCHGQGLGALCSTNDTRGTKKAVSRPDARTQSYTVPHRTLFLVLDAETSLYTTGCPWPIALAGPVLLNAPPPVIHNSETLAHGHPDPDATSFAQRWPSEHHFRPSSHAPLLLSSFSYLISYTA